MERDGRYVRPVFLIEGGNYLLLESEQNGHPRVFKKVILTAYDSCPAFVIVRNEFGDKQRCPRESLFISTRLSPQAQ